jgi:hypothetical protein
MLADKISNAWVGMPEFVQEKQTPYHLINISIKDTPQIIICRFENESHLNDFSKRIEQNVTTDIKKITISDLNFLSKAIDQKFTMKSKSIWHPQIIRGIHARKRYAGDKSIKNKYPVYIVSKGRAHNGLTWKALDKMSVDYKIVIESQEFDLYSKYIDKNKLLILPQKFLDDYDTCDNHGTKKSPGPGAARNFVMAHSSELGHKRHWVLDDNLDDFHRLHDNMKVPVRCPSTFKACEDFVDRYKNVPVAGMNYYSFCKTTDKCYPLTFNTRIYSCLLIENNTPYFWRGRYNEDTDLSLRVLKDGNCTIQFNAFLCGKVTTQRMRGGNSKEFYDEEGTKDKSQMIEDLHPDVAKVMWRFNRWHHYVNYKSFENTLIPVNENIKYKDSDNFSMYLIDGVKGRD